MPSRDQPSRDQPSRDQRFREHVEQRSVVMLTYLNSLPRAAPFTLMLALLFAGLLTTGVLAFAALSLVAAFLGWLLYVGWPLMSSAARVLRLGSTLLVGAVAVNQLLR